MTRYAIDELVALRLIEGDVVVPTEHSLVAPGALRSEVLSLLYRGVRAGERTQQEASVLLDRLAALRVRLLADRVSRRTAWRIAERLGHDDTHRAEYLAVASLQADALVTLDEDLARAADGIVATAPASVLLG